jgi:hypothetical protein
VENVWKLLGIGSYFRKLRFCCHTLSYSGTSKVNSLIIRHVRRSANKRVYNSETHLGEQDRRWAVCIPEPRSRNHWFRGRTINIIYSVCVCVCVCVCLCFSYSARNAHEPYYIVIRLYHIFTHDLTNGTIYGKIRHLNTKCVSFSSINLSETFLILRRNQWDIVVRYKSAYVLVNARSSCNLNFLARFSEKSSNVKFPENMSDGCPVVPCERTGRRTDGGKWRSY